MTLDEARLQKAREISLKVRQAAENNFRPYSIDAALAALVEANWQPPEDPDIAASKQTLPPYLIWKDAEAVKEQAREIALAAYKAGKAAR